MSTVNPPIVYSEIHTRAYLDSCYNERSHFVAVVASDSMGIFIGMTERILEAALP